MISSPAISQSKKYLRSGYDVCGTSVCTRGAWYATRTRGRLADIRGWLQRVALYHLVLETLARDHVEMVYIQGAPYSIVP